MGRACTGSGFGAAVGSTSSAGGGGRNARRRCGLGAGAIRAMLITCRLTQPLRAAKPMTALRVTGQPPRRNSVAICKADRPSTKSRRQASVLASPHLRGSGLRGGRATMAAGIESRESVTWVGSRRAGGGGDRVARRAPIAAGTLCAVALRCQISAALAFAWPQAEPAALRPALGDRGQRTRNRYYVGSRLSIR